MSGAGNPIFYKKIVKADAFTAVSYTHLDVYKRQEQDSCVVAILDERAGIGGKYHDAALAALPTCPITEKDVYKRQEH